MKMNKLWLCATKITLTHISSSQGRQVQEYLVYDSIHIKLKNRQNYSILIEKHGYFWEEIINGRRYKEGSALKIP